MSKPFGHLTVSGWAGKPTAALYIERKAEGDKVSVEMKVFNGKTGRQADFAAREARDELFKDPDVHAVVLLVAVETAAPRRVVEKAQKPNDQAQP